MEDLILTFILMPGSSSRFLLCLNHFLIQSYFNTAPEVSVYESWWFLPTLLGLRLKETVVNMDRMRQVQPALLFT